MTHKNHNDALHVVHSVFYNDGTNEDNFALVVGTHPDGKLDLVYFVGGEARAANNVPRREKSDYGPEGGGVTWHTG